MAVYLSSAGPINSADRNFAKLCASIILNATTMSRQRWVGTVTLAFSPQLASVSVSTYCSDNITKLARKMIWSCGKSLASAKGQWTSMFRTCWSPQADPDPNFEPQPCIYIHIYIYVYMYISILWNSVRYHVQATKLLHRSSLWDCRNRLVRHYVDNILFPLTILMNIAPPYHLIEFDACWICMLTFYANASWKLCRLDMPKTCWN